MGRERIQAEPLTNAEKQRRFREKRREELTKLRTIENIRVETAGHSYPISSMREVIKEELRRSWEPEAKAERIAAVRKQGRELAKRADLNHEWGRVTGICEAADFFVGTDRGDIAKALLSHFMIDRGTAAGALEADRRTRSLILASLEKSEAWDRPGKVT